jgi:hypothetical protein
MSSLFNDIYRFESPSALPGRLPEIPGIEPWFSVSRKRTNHERRANGLGPGSAALQSGEANLQTEIV